MKSPPPNREKTECIEQHFFDLLNWNHLVIGEEDRKSAMVICRKCGILKIVKVYEPSETRR